MSRKSSGETTVEAAQRLRDKLMLECAERAIDALAEVAGDKKAPAPARATAGAATIGIRAR